MYSKDKTRELPVKENKAHFQLLQNFMATNNFLSKYVLILIRNEHGRLLCMCVGCVASDHSCRGRPFSPQCIRVAIVCIISIVWIMRGGYIENL